MGAVSVSRAVTQARWTKAGTDDTAYWWNTCIFSLTGRSAMHQPTRQPVMAQGLEKLLTATIRSRMSVNSAKL